MTTETHALQCRAEELALIIKNALEELQEINKNLQTEGITDED